jgi:hypothetical protein
MCETMNFFIVSLYPYILYGQVDKMSTFFSSFLQSFHISFLSALYVLEYLAEMCIVLVSPMNFFHLCFYLNVLLVILLHPFVLHGQPIIIISFLTLLTFGHIICFDMT